MYELRECWNVKIHQANSTNVCFSNIHQVKYNFFIVLSAGSNIEQMLADQVSLFKQSISVIHRRRYSRYKTEFQSVWKIFIRDTPHKLFINKNSSSDNFDSNDPVELSWHVQNWLDYYYTVTEKLVQNKSHTLTGKLFAKWVPGVKSHCCHRLIAFFSSLPWARWRISSFRRIKIKELGGLFHTIEESVMSRRRTSDTPIP